MTGRPVIYQPTGHEVFTRLPRARRRLIVLGIILAFALTVAGAVTLWLSVVSALSRDRTQLDQQIVRLERTVQSARDKVKSFDTVLKAPKRARSLTAETSVRAMSDLEDRVKSVIEISQAKLITIQPVQSPADHHGEVALRVHLRTAYDEFAQIAYELRTGTPTVVIRSAEIQPALETGINDVRLTLFALWEADR